MKKVLLALVLVALIAVPAMASVQNVKVSGDIENTYVNRRDFDLGSSNPESYRQSAFIMQTRLRVDADLTDKVSATVGLINERVWGASNDTVSSDIDLNLAYVTMKEMLYSPLTVTIGRQNFAFGNSFVIDSAGPNNAAQGDSGLAAVAVDLTKQTAQDAIRLTFDYNPLTIDVLYSAIDQNSVTGAIQKDNVDLVGINAAYQFNDEKNTMVEGYMWYKQDNSILAAGTDVQARADTVYTSGVRSSLNVLDGWNLQGEVAYQTGVKNYAAGSNAVRQAYAGQVLSNYSLPFSKKYEPVLGTSYTYYSGDTNGTNGDDRYSAWDPMYENQAGGKIYNVLFNATNCHIIGANLMMVPAQDVTANLYYDYLRLAKAVPANFTLGQPTGTAVASPGQELDGKTLGQEVGLMLTYDYTEDVQFGLNTGVFFPGSRFETVGDDKNNNAASQVLLSTKVAF